MKAATPKGRSRKPVPTPVARAVRLEWEGTSTAAVLVAGTFNEWKPEATPMRAVRPGLWAAELALAPGRYEYLLVVDGQWQVDPRCAAQVPNPFGGMNCVLEVAPPT